MHGATIKINQSIYSAIPQLEFYTDGEIGDFSVKRHKPAEFIIERASEIQFRSFNISFVSY